MQQFREIKLLVFREDKLPLSLLALLPILYLSGTLFSNDRFLGSPFTDLKSFIYIIKSISEISIPLWNPYVFGGMPFMATIHPAIFYPFNVIFSVLPLTYAINWNIAFHLFLSGSFTYYLLKYHGIGRFGATMGGIIYTFSAPQIMHIYAGHKIAMASMPWTPLMILFLERFMKEGKGKYGIFLSFTVAIQLLAGYPQYLFYSLIMISFQCVVSLIWLRTDGADWKKIWTKSLAYAGVIFLGFALAAVQILPTAEILKYSTRENLSYEWISMFSFPPENLITLLIPDFFGDMIKLSYWGKNYLWEMTAYVGIMPLMFAGIAVFYVRSRVVCFFAGIAIVSIIFAMGKYTPLLKFLYNYVPGFNLFRGNSKFIFLTALSLSILSGIGADALLKGIEPLRKKSFRIYLLCLTIAVIAVTAFLMFVSFDITWFQNAINRAVYSGDFYENPTSVTAMDFGASAASFFSKRALWSIAFLILATAVLLMHSYGILKGKAVPVIVTVIVIFDLFSFGMRYMVTFGSREVYWDQNVVNFLKQDKEPFRVIAPEMAVNAGAASGIETLSGYDTIMIKRYSEFINFSQGFNPDKAVLWLNINSVNKLTDMLNARYLVLQSGPAFDMAGYKLVFDNGKYSIYQNASALPRAFVVHGYKVVKGRDRIFQEMASPGFHPLAYAVAEEEISGMSVNPTAMSEVPKVEEHLPNYIKIEANLIEKGLLVLGDVYYPGWKVFVDGRESPIHRVNYIMRSVIVPQGNHVVEFRYNPLSFKIGSLISLTSLIFATAFLVWDKRR